MRKSLLSYLVPLHTLLISCLLSSNLLFQPLLSSQLTTIDQPYNATPSNVFDTKLSAVATETNQPANAAPTQNISAVEKGSLRFETNQGQIDKEVKFFAYGLGYDLYLTANQAVLDLKKPVTPTSQANLRTSLPGKPATPESVVREGTVVMMNLVGANPSPQVQGLEPLSSSTNYFIGNEATKWITDVTSYSRVRCSNVYSKIDLVYYGQGGQLEYDFIVAPGGDFGSISLQFEGMKGLEIAPNGEVILDLGISKLRQKAPVIYQENNGMRQTITGGYILKGHNQLGFSINNYDHSKPLIIDPIIVYTDYLGSGSDDEGYSITVDNLGNSYITGYTPTALEFPRIAGSYVSLGALGKVAFVTKLAPNSQLIYSALIGGTSDSLNANTTNIGYGVAVDAGGSIYLTGSTDRPDFPVRNPFQTCLQSVPNQGGDAFVLKLNPLGSALVWSTCLGGNRGDGGFGIALSKNCVSDCSVYVTGLTNSTNFPGAGSGGDAAGDGFVVGMKPDGSGLLFSRYLRGSGSDQATSIAADGNGNTYVVGYTSSTDFPTRNALFNGDTKSTPDIDGFAVKLDNTGGLVYSTYIKGNGIDAAWGVAVDDIGNTSITGQTNSSDFVVTPKGFQFTPSNGQDVFVLKLATSSSASLAFSTYLGGTGIDVGYGVAIDNSQNIFVVGETDSLNFPKASTQYFGGGKDVFIARLNSNLSNCQPLLDATYLGGRGSDTGYGIAVNGDNAEAYSVGTTYSSNFPRDPGFFIYNTDAVVRLTNKNVFIAKHKLNIRQDDIPGIVDDWDRDDLYTQGIVTTTTNSTTPSLSFDFTISRYYGLVNSSGKLIDTDPAEPAGPYKAVNATLHEPNVTLHLWVKTGGPQTVAQPQIITVTVTGGPNNISTQLPPINLPANPNVSNLVTVTIPVSYLYFPDICAGPSIDRTTRPCLRNPDKKNYPDNATNDGESKFAPIVPTRNNISITSSQGNKLLSRLSCVSYLYLNGVRPVLFPAGFELSNQLADTTKDWGSTRPIEEQLLISGNYTTNNWIKWLRDIGIPSWNPPGNGSRRIADQQQYIKAGAVFLNRVYGVKKINLMGVSFGGLTARQFTYDANINDVGNIRVDKIITLDSPHTGMSVLGFVTPNLFGQSVIPASIDIGQAQMNEFNKRYNNLRNGWSDENSKEHIFLATVHGQRNECLYNIIGIPTCFNIYVPTDNIIESKSGLGTSYAQNFPAFDSYALPSSYATYVTDTNLLNICAYVLMGAGDDKCHTWPPHSPQIANWILNTLGILSYQKNQKIPLSEFSLSGSGGTGQSRATIKNSIDNQSEEQNYDTRKTTTSANYGSLGWLDRDWVGIITVGTRTIHSLLRDNDRQGYLLRATRYFANIYRNDPADTGCDWIDWGFNNIQIPCPKLGTPNYSLCYVNPLYCGFYCGCNSRFDAFTFPNLADTALESRISTMGQEIDATTRISTSVSISDPLPNIGVAHWFLNFN